MRGYAFALAAPLCWGLSAVFIKLGLGQGLPPVAATLLSISIAVPLNYVVIRSLPGYGQGKPLDRRTLAFALSAGGVMTLANLLYFVAIDLESVAIAVPLSNLSPVFTLGLAYVFLRRERVTPRLVLGTLTILLGAYLIAAR